MLERFFLDGVLVEPGYGAQPPGDGRAGTAAGFQFAGEGLDVGAADREQRKRPGAAPAGELPQVEGAGLTGQSAVAGQNPASASRSASVNTGCTGAREVEGIVAAIGHLLGQPGPGSWVQAPARNDARNVRRPRKTGYPATSSRRAASAATRGAPYRRFWAPDDPSVGAHSGSTDHPVLRALARKGAVCGTVSCERLWLPVMATGAVTTLFTVSRAARCACRRAAYPGAPGVRPLRADPLRQGGPRAGDFLAANLSATGT